VLHVEGQGLRRAFALAHPPRRIARHFEEHREFLVQEIIVGPLFYRMFVRHQPLNDAFVTRVFQCVVKGLAKSD